MKDTYIMYAVAGIVLLFLGSKLLKKLPNLSFSGTPLDPKLAEEQKKSAANILESRMFDPNYWKDIPAVDLMPESSARMLARKIHESWGFWDDDEDQINSALNQAKTFAQISQITFQYDQQYGQDLFTVFAQNLNAHEINLMWQLLKNKPRN